MHHFVILWIVCCIILHNLIIRFEESNGSYNINEWWTGAKGSGNDAEDIGDGEDDEQVWVASGEDLRDKLMTALLDAFDNPDP